MACCLSPCCAAPCVPAVPFCSCPPIPMRVQYVGEPKLCSTLCNQGVDEPLNDDALERPCYRNTKNPYTKKMGYPVGVMRSLVASSDKALYFDDVEMNGQRFGMCLKAFAFLHIMPVYEWTRNMLDGLMQEGAELYSLGPEEPAKNELDGGIESTIAAPENIYTSNELGIRRAFKLKGYDFEVELDMRFNPRQNENAAGDSLPDINASNLKGALKSFFKKRQYCLLSTNNLYLFIWKADGVYFVLDFYGRNAKLDSSRDEGFATLVCVRAVSNVNYLITNKTTLGKKDTFTLREMRLALLVDPEGRAQLRSFDNNRADEFLRVNKEYAYLRAKLHLSLKEKDPLVSRCALPVGIAAIIASKIDHPASWDTRTLDKIICYGFFICRCCWEFCQNSQTPIDYESFPNQLQIGQFAVNLTILPKVSQGTWHCVPKFEATELYFILQKTFENGHNYFLLTINQQTYAIWKKNSFYYFFDPYRHLLPHGDVRSASLRMFNSLETLTKVLNLVLLQSNTKSTFFIHRVIVTDIRKSSGLECLPTVPKQPCPEDLVDVQSINDGICFREDYKRCFDDLGQISEDDEEDYIDEADLLVDEEEEEIPAGEEEEEGELLGFDEHGRRIRRKGRGGRYGRYGRFGRYGRGGKGGRWGKGRKGGKGKRGTKDRGTSTRDRKKKGKNRERAGTTDSEKEEAERKKRKGSRPSSRSSRGRKSRGSKGRKSRASRSSRRSKSRGSRRSKSRGSRRSKSRGSRRSKSRGSRGSKSRGSRRSKSRGSRGSKSRRSRSRRSGSKSSRRSRDSKGRRRRSRGSKGRRRRSRDSKGRLKGSESQSTDSRDGSLDSQGRKKDRHLGADGYGKDGKGHRGADGYGKDGKGRGYDGEGSGSSTTFDHLAEGYGYGEDGHRRRRPGEDDEFYIDEFGNRQRRRDDEYYIDEFGQRRRKRDGVDDDEFELDEFGRRVRKDRYGYDRDAEGEGTVCRPNAYPGYRCIPYNMAVVGSESGSYESICKLLRAGFKCADRILVMTPFGNFVVFRGCSMFKRTYFVFDGCTCNVERFRHLDLNCGTAGLLCFNNLHSVITYMIDTRKIRKCLKKSRAQIVDEICNRYCK